MTYELAIKRALAKDWHDWQYFARALELEGKNPTQASPTLSALVRKGVAEKTHFIGKPFWRRKDHAL